MNFPACWITKDRLKGVPFLQKRTERRSWHYIDISCQKAAVPYLKLDENREPIAHRRVDIASLVAPVNKALWTFRIDVPLDFQCPMPDVPDDHAPLISQLVLIIRLDPGFHARNILFEILILVGFIFVIFVSLLIYLQW